MLNSTQIHVTDKILCFVTDVRGGGGGGYGYQQDRYGQYGGASPFNKRGGSGGWRDRGDSRGPPRRDDRGDSLLKFQPKFKNTLCYPSTSETNLETSRQFLEFTFCVGVITAFCGPANEIYV